MRLEFFNTIDELNQRVIISGFLLGGYIFTVGIFIGKAFQIMGAALVGLSILHYLRMMKP